MFASSGNKSKFWPVILSCSSLFLSHSLTARAAGGVLNEEVIEAQKKIETVTDTPIAVSAISGDRFLGMGNFVMQDLGRTTAGLSLEYSTFPDIRMRGVGSVTRGSDLSLRTNLYQDGALVEQPRALLDAQFDIERFEILRGPQGTLYGKASPSGTINIRTKNPNLRKMDGYVSTSAGQYNMVNTQFGVSVPIIEGELAVRLAGVYDENEATGQKNITLGQNSQTRSQAGRMTVLWQPNSDFDARLSYNYREKTSNVWSAIDGAGHSFDDDILLSDVPDSFRQRDQLAVLELNQVLAEHLSLTSLTAYEKQRLRLTVDGDATASPRSVTAADALRDPLWQQDLRLLSDDNDFWDWQLGLFYLRSHGNTAVDSNTFGVFHILSDAISNREEHAVYTHDTFKFTEQLNVILGLRYQETRGNNHTPSTVAPILPVQFDGINADAQALNDYGFTGNAKVQYYFTPDLVGYVSLDRARRAGSSNPNLFTSLPLGLIVVHPETANSWELGLKGNFWNQRGRFSATLYDQVYKNFQQDISTTPVYNASPFLRVLPYAAVNAKEAETRGLELSAALLLLDRWDVDAGLIFNEARYNDFKDFPCGLPAGVSSVTQPNPGYYQCDLSGQRLPQAPMRSGRMASHYSLPITSGLDWYANGLLQYTGSQIDALTRRKLGGFATLDFFTGLRSGIDKGWDVSLWVKNAFNRRAITRVTGAVTFPLPNGYAGPGYNYEAVNANLPRQVGLTGVYHFE